MRYLLVLLLALVTGGASVQATTVSSGLYGVVTRGPITPVCAAEVPCTAPAAGAVLVFSRNGTDVARVTAAGDGSYRVHLPAAAYAVRTGHRRLEPTTTRVYASRMRHVDFSIDTGIR